MMPGWVDSLLDVMCHRSGEYSDALPLCLRCSGVYAGVLCGILFECLIRVALRPCFSRAVLWVGVAGFAVMAGVGFGNIYGVFGAQPGVKVFVALWFGASVSFFACAALGHEFSNPKAPGAASPTWRSLLARGVFLLLLVLWSGAVHHGSLRAVRLLGWAASVGIPAGFLTVNAALALVLVRTVPRVRLCLCLLLIPVFAAVELTVFALWRQLFSVASG